MNPVLTGLLSNVIIEPDEIETDKLSLPYAARFVWWGSHSGRVFCAMKKILNPSRCSLCLGEFRLYRPVTLSSGKVAEVCWDCYQKERGKTNYQPGWVYVIGHGDFWKVGKTQGKPESRLKELQVGNPHCLQIFDAWLVQDCCIAERFAHSALRELHHRGEWFRGDPSDIVSLIKNWRLGMRS